MSKNNDAILSARQSSLFEGALDLLVAKIEQDERSIGVEFPHVTAPDGRWQTYPASWSAGYTGDAWNHGLWTCGYWVGLLLAAHLRSGDQNFLVWARERMRLVAQRADVSQYARYRFYLRRECHPWISCHR